MDREYEHIAHVRRDEKDGQWKLHGLSSHLQGASIRARKFAEVFGNADWAEFAALWHDLGKFLPDWQKYIRKTTGYDEDACVFFGVE